MAYWIILLAIGGAYLIGSISSAILVCRLLGLPDPRSQGSLNPGASNVLRIGTKKAAVITLAGDLFKGLLPVILGKWYGFSPLVLSLIACAAFLGHLYPIYFNFAGGKGVATGLGALFGLSFLLGLCVSLTWLIVAFLLRYASLASCLAFLLAPVFTWFLTHSSIYFLAICFLSVMVIYRHRSNISNLAHGTEHKLGQKTAA